ncbi:MAG: hypothetical protein LAQ30_08980 [Acidobacteriia bacterium]|nr:hypothetical protein [Terriglobia bacterium]
MRVVLLLVVPLSAYTADFCSKNDVQGAYGFQLAGVNTISGFAKASATIGRIAFQSDGTLSGYSSVNFNGLFLGNPVTGTWDVKPDCAITWNLQDDSGGYQHFAGKTVPGGSRVEFRQSDPGADGAGIMKKTPETCGVAAFQGQYGLTMAGISTPFAGGAPKQLSAVAVADADGAGALTLLYPSDKSTGSYDVDSDCFMEIRFTLPSGGAAAGAVKLRGILVDDGREALAVQSDPKDVSAARFRK